ncbi:MULTISPECIES: ligase-associated DNA damage response endonuclease PdeM [unclassified Pseudomonas]|uniref:ligase-associated DNA damage response endonuclease PdeM n=1 Tax=unclassified Pseudomonas TaxID=196821 RepID=UPI0028D724E9|nr:ligase-associated DNA damage response endonuclease PdeM [uncultured Pseudomonas sp.]
MTRSLTVHLEGEDICLLAEKALYWPRHRALLIADAHFGKAAAYRRLGQPVPVGTTQTNLNVLDQLLAEHDCQQIIFLGDFLHAKESHAPRTLALLEQWRERHAELKLTLIRGNHDLRAGDPPAQLRIEVVAEPLLITPFALQHEPVPHSTHHVLAGHVHPTFRLHGKGRQSVRAPCFSLGDRISLLPAFGAFTGGMNIDADASTRRIYLIADRAVWPLTLYA